MDGRRKAVTKDGVVSWHHVLHGVDWEKIGNGEDHPFDISDKFGVEIYQLFFPQISQINSG